MLQFTYPVKLTRDGKHRGYVVSCRDIPETITQGVSIEHTLSEAEGALQAAIECQIEDGLDIPAPSPAKRGERVAPTPISTALKAAVYTEMRGQRVSKSELARRMLDPRHPTRVPTLECALAVLGRRAEIAVS